MGFKPRPPPTGMEARWEEWVLATLNFLHGQLVITYRDDNKELGVLDIPDRLKILAKTIYETKVATSRARSDFCQERREHRKTITLFHQAGDVIEQVYRLLVLQDDCDMPAIEKLHGYLLEYRPDVLEEDEDGES